MKDVLIMGKTLLNYFYVKENPVGIAFDSIDLS
jgi:hypothetical protein